jgi:hypothetical protein
LQPDFKITSLRNHNLFSFAKQESAGVIVLVGRDDPLPLDFEKTEFDAPKGGFPIYTMRNTEPQNGCEIQMTAFATSDEHPICYQSLTLTNRGLSTVHGSIGLMLRAASSGAQALTALSPSGYCRYAPNPRAWFMQREIGITQVSPTKCKCEGGKGFLQILSAENANVHFVSYEEPKRFSADDYFACDYTLSAGEAMTVDFVFSDAPLPRKPLSFEAAISDALNSELAVFCYENCRAKTLRSLLEEKGKDIKSVSVIVGCEGGFSEREAEYIESLGAHAVTLGKRILRCETAPLFALSALSYHFEL